MLSARSTRRDTLGDHVKNWPPNRLVKVKRWSPNDIGKLVRPIFRVVAILAALLATIQPVLGSFAYFGGGTALELDEVHLVVGGILYNLAIVLAVLPPFTGLPHRWSAFVICLIQFALLHAQLRLGLGSNSDPSLLAFHIPVGVAIFFVTYLTTALSFGVSFSYRR